MSVKAKDREFRLREAENGWLLMEDGYEAGAMANRIWTIAPDLSDLVETLTFALDTPAAPKDEPLVRLKPGALKRAKQERKGTA